MCFTCCRCDVSSYASVVVGVTLVKGAPLVVGVTLVKCASLVVGVTLVVMPQLL